MKPKKLPHWAKFLLGLVSGILCVALFFSAVSAITLANVRTLTTEENIKVIVRFVLFGEDVRSASVAPQAVGVMRQDEFSMDSGMTSDVILDMLYELLNEQVGEGEDIPFTTEDVQEFLDQSTLPDFLTDKVSGIMTDIITGEVTTTITGAEVGQLLDDNKALIEETLGIEFTDDYKYAIVEKVNEMDMTNMVQNIVMGKDPMAEPGEGDAAEGEDSANYLFKDGVLPALIAGTATFEDVFNGGLPVILQLLREITSEDMMNLSILVCVILAVLLLVVNLVQLHEGVRCIGATVMLASAPFAAASIAALAAPSMFTGVLSLMYIGLTINAGLSIGVFVFGLILLIASFILGKIYKKQLQEA